MKIVAQINCYNSDLYLLQVLKSIYDHMDRIVIIDGAFTSTIPTRYSTDNTANIVKGFNDVDKKIVYIKTYSSSQNEQRDKIFNYADGMDYLMIIDDDELFKPNNLKTMRKYLENPPYHSFRLRGYNFVNSFDWYYETCNMRVWKIVDGMYYTGSNSIQLKSDRGFYDKMKSPVIPGVIRYHYSYVRKPERLSIKIEQVREFQNKDFPWKLDGRFVKRDGIKLKHFTGSHPPVLKGHPCSKIKWSPKV